MVSVKVETVKKGLRLRWTHEGHRYSLGLGLEDTETNRAIARLKAAEIERDIEYEMFDISLDKYRGKPHGKSQMVSEVFEKFIEFKRPQLYPQTLTKYNGLLTSLKNHFRTRQAGGLSRSDCEKFKEYLSSHLKSSRTVKEQLGLLVAAWDWAIDRGRLPPPNSWKGVVKQVKDSPLPAPKPFSPAEIRNILQAFREHPKYKHYADYVEFLLGTGCRVGEAIALTWSDISADCSQVWFGDTYSASGLKALKAGEAGFVPLSQSLKVMLQRRRPADAAPDALVFPAPRGGYLNKSNFRKRAWAETLEAAGVPYRKPYTSRSTLISYWLAQGEDPLIVAKFTRTSVRMIYQRYAGYIPARATLPDILSDALSPLDSGDGVLE